MPLPADPLILANHFIFPGSPPTSLVSPKIFLPIFQREAVWDPSQICELWDSLLRGIPLPSLILAEYDPNIKPQAEISGAPVQPAPGDYFLIDGQQRARAVLAALDRIFVDFSFSNHSCDENSAGNNSLAQRLWLDLDWPHKANANDPKGTLDIHGLRFGFFLCTQSTPWGHNLARTGSPNPGKIRKAREILFKSGLEPNFKAGGSKQGCFDFELSLEHTWPVEAKCPVPFKDILDHFITAGPHSPVSWESFLKGIIQKYAKMRTLNHASSHPLPTCLTTIANQLFYALPRISNPGLNCIEADIDVDDLIPAFQRINRNGTEVKNDELFFATIKKRVPSLYALAKHASETLPPLDVVRGAVILATQPTATSALSPANRRGASPAITPPIDLSPANLRSLELAAMTASGSGLPLSTQLWNDLSTTPMSFKTALDELTKIIAYRGSSLMPASDPGLPAVMFSRLKVSSWLPPLAWLIEWRALHPEKQLDNTERSLLLRYILMNHFFADWYPDEPLMLRDLLDFVKDNARNGNNFPEVCEIRNHLACYVKPNTGNAPAWLRKADVSKGGHLVLPLTPIEWTKFFNHWAANTNGWLTDTNNYGGLLPGLAEDLLMWSQRHVMDDWFKLHAKNIALFGKLGKPWDVDHIVPDSFFYFTGRSSRKPIAASPFLTKALSSKWLGLNSAVPHWDNISNIANRLGNKRLWPSGFNRSHGNISAKDKLQTTWLRGRNSWEVLSYWPRSRISGNLILSASRIDTKLCRCWNLTPSNTGVPWKYSNLKAFLYATLASQRGREVSIYRELFQVLEPGLKCHPDWAKGASGNRI